PAPTVEEISAQLEFPQIRTSEITSTKTQGSAGTRRSFPNATWSMQEVCAFVSKTAGTVALRAGTLQRLFRDMNAGTPHITSAQVSSAPPAVSSQASHLANVGFFWISWIFSARGGNTKTPGGDCGVSIKFRVIVTSTRRLYAGIYGSSIGSRRCARCGGIL